MRRLPGFMTSEIWQLFVSLSPLGLLVAGIFVFDALKDPMPNEGELHSINGEIVAMSGSQGTIRSGGRVVSIDYPCLCDYGWGKYNFEAGTSVAGRGVQKGEEFYLWDLRVGGWKIFSFEELIEEKSRQITAVKRFAFPILAISFLFFIQFVYQHVQAKRYSKQSSTLSSLFESLANADLPDEERLRCLEQLCAFDAEDILESLEFLATNNTVSKVVLEAIGGKLGKIWLQRDIDYLEPIVYLQPAAKEAAVAVLKGNSELYHELVERGAVYA